MFYAIDTEAHCWKFPDPAQSTSHPPKVHFNVILHLLRPFAKGLPCRTPVTISVPHTPLQHLDFSTLLTQQDLIPLFPEHMLSKENKTSPHSLVSYIPSQLLAFPLHLQHDVERNLGTPRQMLPAPVLYGK